MDLYGNAKWPGVEGLRSFNYTRSLGITAGAISMVVPPQPASGFAQNADLKLSFGGYQRTLEDCLLDKVKPVINDEGFIDWRLELWDRRWRWKDTGKISGRYNVRRVPGKIEETTKKRLRDLARLCLKAMNEGDGDIDALPHDVFLEIDWDYANPAAALEDLCNSVGCRVGLGRGDRLTVFKLGKGRQLPSNAMEGGLTFDPPDLPGKLVIVGARSKYQFDAKLIPVGLDLDQKVKPIDKLSYTPTAFGIKTWAYSDAEHFHDVKDLRARKLAQQTVWRWYQIGGEHLVLPKVPKPVENLDDVLPLNDFQVYTHKVGERTEPMPSQVYGSWWNGGESNKPEVDPAEVKRNLDGSAEGLYYQGFHLDTKTGIVKFSQAVYSHKKLDVLPTGEDAVAGQKIIPAAIWLKACCGLRDKETRGWTRGEFTRAWRIAGRPVRRRGQEESVKYKLREDLEYAAWKDWAAGGNSKDNKTEFDEIGEEYFAAVEAEYVQNESGSASYRGWVDVENDGAIQQLSYILTEGGFAITRVSRNREEAHISPSYKERRMVEKILLSEEKMRERFMEEILAKRA